MNRSFIRMFALLFIVLASALNAQAQEPPVDGDCIEPGQYMPVERLSCSSLMWGAGSFAVDLSLQPQLQMPGCKEVYTLRLADCYSAGLNARRYFDSSDPSDRCESDVVLASNLECTFDPRDPRMVRCSSGTVTIMTHYSSDEHRDLILVRTDRRSSGTLRQTLELDAMSCYYKGPLR